MSLPTVKDVQAIDPVLTNMLVGYMQADARFIAPRLFPYVPVEKDSGTFYTFTKKYWFTDELEERAPGAPFARLGMGVGTDTFTTLQWAAEYPIADEVRANSQLPLDLEQAALRFLAQKSLIRKERAFSADFMVTGVWGTDNTTATDWDDFAAGDPVTDVMTAKRTISNNTGMDGNTMALGYIVHQALCAHPDILDRIAYTAQANQATIENALSAIFGVNYIVGKASFNSANEGQAASMAAIVDDDCLVAYVAPAPGVFEASAGYTFVWGGGGGAGSIYRQRDGLRHTDVIQHKEQWDQKAVATDCGYFFSDVV